MQSVSRIGVMSLARIMAVAYGVLGLFIGGLLSLFSLMGAAMGTKEAGALGMIFGVGAVVIAPILYGCLGFIGGVITAGLYNLVAKVAGGVEIELS